MSLHQNNTVWEVFQDHNRITATVDANVTGKTFVKLATSTDGQELHVVPAAAGDVPFGVAANDAVAGDTVGVYRRGAYTVTAGAALTSPALVAVGANGSAVAAAADAASFGYIVADAATGTDATVFLSL